MRAPPAFEVTLRDAPGWRVAQALLWALAGAALGAWAALRVAAWLDAASGDSLAGLAAAAGAGLAACIGWRLARPREMRLRWSGRNWELQAHGAWHPVGVRAMLDLGGWMLLRIRPGSGRARWLGPAEAALGGPGHLLRAALYCAPCVDPGRAEEDRARS